MIFFIDGEMTCASAKRQQQLWGNPMQERSMPDGYP
jgi:hypothetical protein